MMRSSLLYCCALLMLSGGALWAQESPPAGPVAAIEDPMLRQILPAPQMRNGAVDAGWWTRHLRDMREAEAAKSAGPVHLLFVGDSITDNYRKTGPAPNQVFQPIWQEFFAPHNAVNLGVSGDSTEHVLWRLEHGEADGLSPEDIVLLIGTNNTWHDGKAAAEDVAEGIKAVVYSLHVRMPKARVVVLAILPSGVSPEKSAKDAAINRMVEAAFAHSAFARTLDLGKLFAKPDGTLDLSLFYDPAMPNPGKAVHPNTAGQRKVAEAVAKALYGDQHQGNAQQ